MALQLLTGDDLRKIKRAPYAPMTYLERDFIPYRVGPGSGTIHEARYWMESGRRTGQPVWIREEMLHDYIRLAERLKQITGEPYSVEAAAAHYILVSDLEGLTWSARKFHRMWGWKESAARKRDSIIVDYVNEWRETFTPERWQMRADALKSNEPPPSKHRARLAYPAWMALRNRILARDDWTCRYCGDRSPFMEADHVIPVAKGGVDTEENLVTACRRCNRQKKDKSVEEFLAWKAAQ